MEELTENSVENVYPSARYTDLFHNRAFMLLLGSKTISDFGDIFFNIAVLWIVYAASGSALQTALIQVVWQLSDAVMGPFAGVWVDRWERKKILVVSNVLATLVVLLLALSMAILERPSPILILLAIFLLNSITTFSGPARFALMPTIVSKDLLTSASGLLTTCIQIATLIGSSAAGFVISTFGNVWAIIIDAITFLLAAILFGLMPIPPLKRSEDSPDKKRRSMWGDLGEAWRVIDNQPVIKNMTLISILLNVASFLGPLYPALIQHRLHQGASAYGFIYSMAILGGIVGSSMVGKIEGRVGAGNLFVTGWVIAAVCTMGIGLSQSLVITSLLMATMTIFTVMGAVASSALQQALVPEEYLGRVSTITTSMAVIVIPFAALLGGWLTDQIGPAPMFFSGGVWLLGVALLAWSNNSIRQARIVVEI